MAIRSRIIEDKEIYNELQELKDLVAFLSGLKETAIKDRVNAEKVIEIISSLNQPDGYREISVCLDIYDYSAMSRKHKENVVYWRSWAVWFEKDGITIEAVSKLANRMPHDEVFEGHLWYFYYYGFSPNPLNPYYQKKEPLSLFINDAKHYKNYITEKLKDVEVEISID